MNRLSFFLQSYAEGELKTTMNEETNISEKRLFQIAGVILLIAAILKVVTVLVSNVHIDTNYYLNIGANFIEYGGLTPRMWRLDAETNIVAGSGTGYGILLLTYWFQFFGLTLQSGYILMYISGILLLITVFFLARSWWQSTTAGIVATVFVSLTSTFFEIFYIRMDTLGMLSYSLVLLLHIYTIKNERNYLHFFVGVAVILAAEVHILATIYLLAFAFYYFVSLAYQIWQEKRIRLQSASVYFFVGALLSGIIYLLVHVFPDPEAYFVIARDCPICTPANPFKELARYLNFMNSYPAEMLIFALAIATAFWRNTEQDKHILLLILGYALAQAIISPPVYEIYTRHMLPLIVLSVGGLFYKPQNSVFTLTSKQLSLCMTVVTFMLLLRFFNLSSALVHSTPTPNFVTYVRNYVPNDVAIIGSPEWYHYFIDYTNYLSSGSAHDYAVTLGNGDHIAFWEREQPLVYIGALPDDYPEWLYYMDLYDFQQVRDELWVEDAYYDQLVTGISEPIVDYSASQSRIEYGECVTLEWNIVEADSARLNGRNVSLQDDTEVCPATDKEYILSIDWIGSTIVENIMIEVE